MLRPYGILPITIDNAALLSCRTERSALRTILNGAPEASGHGQSSMSEHGYGHEDRANDVIALIAELAFDRPVLIGHSMGGLSGAVVAAKAPKLIRGALLEAPALLSAEEWNSPLHTTWPLDHAADRERSIEALISRGKLANPRWPDEIFPPWAQAKREASLKVFDWFALAAPDVDTIIAQIGVPTLLITGDPDQGVIVIPAQAAAFQAMNPLVQVAHVPWAGHCLRYEQPATVANLARAFLATCFG